MKGTPVIGTNPAPKGVSKNKLLNAACATKPLSHAAINGSRCVKRAFKNVPVQTITAGKIQSPTPVMFSVNWYGGATLTHEKASSVIVIPKFEGLKKWRVPFPAGARKRHFEQIATIDA